MISAIILTNTKDQQIYQMTKKCIDTLSHSACQSLEIIVVETNPQWEEFGCWPEGIQVICPNEKFNYNRFLNIGFAARREESDYIIIANNDLVFYPDWMEKIIYFMDYYHLDSACPVSPGWGIHEDILKQDPQVLEDGRMFGEIFQGYGIGGEFCGWCIVIRNEALEKLLPFDEQFEFWCQDNDMAIKMSNLCMKHALVRYSKVQHLFNQSHRLLSPEELQHFTQGMAERLNQKYA